MSAVQGPPLATTRIVWASIVVSDVLLFVGMHLSRTTAAPADTSLFFVLFALGAVQSAASVLLPPYLHRQGARARALETLEAARAVTPASPSVTTRVFANPGEARLFAQRLFQVSVILSLALAESVAIFGFVLGLQGFSDERVVPFFVVALALMLIRFPREGDAEKMLEKSTGASFP